MGKVIQFPTRKKKEYVSEQIITNEQAKLLALDFGNFIVNTYKGTQEEKVDFLVEKFDAMENLVDGLTPQEAIGFILTYYTDALPGWRD